PAVSLIRERGVIAGVVAEHRGEPVEIRAGAVVLACGGFESNPEMRARYLGPGWELAKIRGTRFNMGAGVNMALAAGARPYGNWSGCHSVAWDINAPPYGDLAIGDQFQKHNYPFGLLINAKGERYVDEGLNFHSHTYAKYGGEIMRQPGMFAWQVFDAKATPLLRSEYRIRRVTKAEANTLDELISPGLYAAGEMVGGLFFHNYCSGTGLMSGATFGRLAGCNAAQWAAQTRSGAHA